MTKWLRTINLGITYLDEFLNNLESFSHRPDLKYSLFDAFIRQTIVGVDPVYFKIPVPNINEFLRKEFSYGYNTALNAFVFSKMNIQRLQLMQAQRQFNQFAAQAKARIVELESEIKRLKT